MKNLIKYIGASIFLFLAWAGLSPQPANAQHTQVSFQVFYDQLSPYGQWIDDPDYGYIWLPDVGPDFQPYATAGRWINTQYGNTWYSDYEWGWAPFHYGRWVQNPYGWAWVPGYEWAPAWVSWRQGSGHYGWAPLGPGVNFSVNINIPLSHWVFVPQRYLFNTSLYRYYTPPRRFNTFYRQTTIINNVYVVNNRNYYGGPDRPSLVRNTRNRVVVRDLQSASRPGRSALSSRTVNLYRPEIDRSSVSSARPGRLNDKGSQNAGNSRPAAVRPGSSRSTATTQATPPASATTRPARATSSTRSTPEANKPAARTSPTTKPAASRTSSGTVATRPSARSQQSKQPARQSAPAVSNQRSSRPAASRPAAKPQQSKRSSRQSSPKAAPAAAQRSVPAQKASNTQSRTSRSAAPARTTSRAASAKPAAQKSQSARPVRSSRDR